MKQDTLKKRTWAARRVKTSKFVRLTIIVHDNDVMTGIVRAGLTENGKHQLKIHHHRTRPKRKLVAEQEKYTSGASYPRWFVVQTTSCTFPSGAANVYPRVPRPRKIPELRSTAASPNLTPPGK